MKVRSWGVWGTVAMLGGVRLRSFETVLAAQPAL
jgi:hypothetical protein